MNAEMERKTPKKPSEYQGEVGKRADFTLIFKSSRQFDGYYGVKSLNRFLDEQGNVFIWWESGNKAPFAEDHKYVIKGTVKSHQEYKGRDQNGSGVKQTTLTRCKIVKEVE
jgi:hypothetical protein